uniref:Uncharacterized protein n=1 Tax=viral metagenome TaxID=1070528 RepID=A0A6C0AE62_9ZZZZ
MLKIKKSKLPEFIKISPNYKDIDDKEYVYIPKNIDLDVNYKKIENINDYSKIIEIVKYFNLKLPKSLKKFQEDIKNQDALLLFLLQKKDDAFIKPIIEQVKENKDFEINIEVYFSKNDLAEDISEKNYYEGSTLRLEININMKNNIFKISDLLFHSDTQEIIKIVENIEKYDNNIEFVLKNNYNDDDLRIIVKDNNIKMEYTSYYFTADDRYINKKEKIIGTNNSFVKEQILSSFKKIKKISKKLEKLSSDGNFFAIHTDDLYVIRSRFLKDDEDVEYDYGFIFDHLDKVTKKFPLTIKDEIGNKNIEEWLIKNKRIIKNYKNVKINFIE